MKKYTFIITLIISLVLISCSRESVEQDIYFEIDEDLLGEVYQDSVLSIGMRVPADWNDLTAQFQDSAREQFELDSDYWGLGLSLRKIFANTTQNISFLLFEFDHTQLDDDEDIAINIFLDRISEDSETLMHGEYQHNKISFIQVAYRVNDMINLKILGETRDDSLFVIDFFIPGELYMDFLATLESTIGSIHPLSV
jgi:hypothetical protein